MQTSVRMWRFWWSKSVWKLLWCWDPLCLLVGCYRSAAGCYHYQPLIWHGRFKALSSLKQPLVVFMIDLHACARQWREGNDKACSEVCCWAAGARCYPPVGVGVMSPKQLLLKKTSNTANRNNKDCASCSAGGIWSQLKPDLKEDSVYLRANIDFNKMIPKDAS